jgi:nitroreductase
MKVSEAVLSRRSIRAFTSKPIKNEIIKDLLALAARSASGGNLQPWKIFVINNDSMKEFLAFQKNGQNLKHQHMIFIHQN